MNMVMIYDYADRLNSAKKIEECRDIAAEMIGNHSEEAVSNTDALKEYYDTAVTIFVMAINRSLSFAMDIDKTSPDFYDLVDANAAEAEKVFREFVDGLEDCALEDYSVFRKYLNKIAEYIFERYNSHSKSDTNYDNISRGIWLSYCMKEIIFRNKFGVSMILNEFTNKHKIQIPYIYVCTCELYHILIEGYKKDNSNPANRIPGNRENDDPVWWLETCIRALRNKELLDIMRDERDNFNTGLNFSLLLPHIEYDKKIFCQYYSYHNNITPELYCSLPLIPMIFPSEFDAKKYTLCLLEVFKGDIDIEEKNKELEKTNQALDEAVKQKNHIMSEFAHTYGNMSAETLGIIADKLLKNPDREIRKLGRQTMMECSIKQDLTAAIQMMRLKFNDNRQELHNQVRSGISLEPGDEYETIADIADEAMQRVMLRIFYDRTDDEKLSEGKYNIRDLLGVDSIDDAVDGFEEDILLGGSTVAEWLCGKGANLELNIGGGFNRLFFKKNSRSAFFFKDIVSECFFNMVKYADLTKPIHIDFSSDDMRYIMSFRNTPTKYAEEYEGRGLESKKEIIGMLNDDTDEDTISDVVWSVADGEFTARIFLKKDFLEGRI